MHSIHTVMFIQDLAMVMLVAGIITILCHRFKQPIVFGYIIAGIILGHHTPPFSFIADELTIKTLAELGIIFLLFSLGLEFNLQKLSKVGVTAFVATISEICLMLLLGYEIGRMFGWNKTDAIFLGAILSISSTTIIIKALDELGIKNETFSQLIFGILVLEDIFAILILGLLSSIALTGSLGVQDVIITASKLTSFLVASLIFGILFVPKFIAYVAGFKSREMLLITVLGLCFGFCLLVVKLEYSVALGAFVIGAIIAESRQQAVIEKLIIPIRDMFCAIFFVSVGLLFNPQVFIHYWLPIFIITIAVIIGKVVSCSLGVLLTGRDGRTAMRVGMGLAQIGEFSFIIASLGTSLNVTSDFLYSIAVAVSIITTLFTPYLIKHSDAFTRYVTRIIPKKFTNVFEIYTTWMQNIQPEKNQRILLKSIKRGFTQILINLFLVIGIFLAGAFVAKTHFGYMIIHITNHYIQKTIIWAFALMVSLPFLIAVYYKIKGLSLILAELSVKDPLASKLTYNVRNIISEVIPILSIIGILIFISILSASILPPLELLGLILLVMTLLIAFLLPWLIKLHSRLQVNLLGAFKKQIAKGKEKV